MDDNPEHKRGHRRRGRPGGRARGRGGGGHSRPHQSATNPSLETGASTSHRGSQHGRGARRVPYNSSTNPSSESAPSGARGRGSHRGRGSRGSGARPDMPPLNYVTRDDIEEMSHSDDNTVIMRVTQNEAGFFKAFAHDKFLKSPIVLKWLITVLYKLSKSSDFQTALRILANLFGSGGDHALFLFHLQQLISQMPSEQKHYIRNENIQALYHLTEIGSFCFQKIPKTVQHTFPIQYIKSTVDLLKNFGNGSDIEIVTLADIEQNLTMLELQQLSFNKEEARPKPKQVVAIGDVDKEPPEHFSTLSILPIPKEIDGKAKRPYLRPNIIRGPYRNWDHYLDVQFRLLKEDFVGPLREGIADHLINAYRGGEVRVYRNVRIRQPVCLSMGIGFDVSFDTGSLRRVNWDYTKRLINGSLLCLSTDNFKTIVFGSVAQRETKKLEHGIVTIKFEGSVNGFRLDPHTQFTMVESVAYLEAYRHVLEKLHAVVEQHEIEMMPFEQYIVKCAFGKIPLPRYLDHHSHTYFDLKGIVEIKRRSVSSQVDLKRPHSWPDASITDLDPSQMRALQAALTQEISVIQGPPGTGKTYVGIKVVKAFLANREVWDPKKTSPILVVCYTNHALDQFLEGIRNDLINDSPPKVTRIGGRCKTEALEECTLYNKVSKARSDRTIPRKEFQEFHEAREDFTGKKDKIIEHLKSLGISNHSILRLSRLKYYNIMLDQHCSQLSYHGSSSPIELWLKLHYEDTDIAQPFVGIEEAPEEELQEAEEQRDEDTEARRMQDDRMVQGTDVIYRASDASEDKPSQGRRKKKNDGEWQTVQMDEKKKRKLIYQHLNGGLIPMTEYEASQVQNIWTLSIHERWRLYLLWRNLYEIFLRNQLESIADPYKDACQEFQKKKQAMDITVVRDSDVVGMTTTGAAKHSHIIKSIRPKILVVEEAAEIFEPHIFTSLSPTVQQLVLIGDHQQLRPKPNLYELETKFDFNISLFERLAMNGCPVQTLNIQHRMRPEIASLITPAIYKELYNHESVEDYDHVKGIGKDVFFITHTEREKQGADDLKSHSNSHEAKYLGALCDYLLKQGYGKDMITILTLYRGQLIEIKSVLRERKILGVRAAVVDDFQGEENQIILLSLVRSNNEGRIGFVGIENRICVALSRAKVGLYIIGNIEMLRDKVKTIWPKVIDRLSASNCIGESLGLYCQLHPDQKVIARLPEDFRKCPEGGCQKKCEYRLPKCGHACKRLCHPYDLAHLEYKCPEKCKKMLDCGHECKNRCYECVDGCKPCKVKVKKVLPLCGHYKQCCCSDDVHKLKCSMMCGKSLACGHQCQEKCSQPCTPKCTVMVQPTVPVCGHTVPTPCHIHIQDIDCPKPCGAPLDCEHTCSGSCSACKRGRLHKGCSAHCGRPLVCGHLCDFPCTPSCPPCTKPCANFCTHSLCSKKCYEPCTPCMEPCDWSCPHFTCTQPCGMPCNRPPCNEPCPEFLECGHRCIGLCGEVCPEKCRVCNEEEVTEILFGNEDEPDARFILLPDCKHIIEVENLDRFMADPTEQQDGEDDQPEAINLKVCPKCKTPVRKCLRYSNDIKRRLGDLENIKQKMMTTISGIDLNGEMHKVRVALSKAGFAGSQNFAEEFAKLEKAAVSKDCLPHILKSKLSFMLQMLTTFDILVKLKGLPPAVIKFNDRIDNLRRELNELKIFIMQKFLSLQQMSDAEAEIRRLSLLAKVTELQVKLGNKKTSMSSEHNGVVVQFLHTLEHSGLSIDKVSEDYEATVVETLKGYCSQYSVEQLSETERMEIIKAIGLPKGHWYKCPNGHPYAIGECGGAMQKGRCPECKAEIGGMSHALAAGNTHASEIDGSRHAAWSDAANMENYDLGNLQF